MKRKFIYLTLSLLLISCNETKDSSNEQLSSEASEEISSTSEISSSEHSYILQDNETYNKINVNIRDLAKLTYNTYKIEGIDKLACDPFSSCLLYDQATISYPTSKLLNNQAILYTSKWYKQTTFKREDECIEYALVLIDDAWTVTKISNTSESFIPFNGAVLSLPSTSSIKYNLNDKINITGTIPSYDIGFYNQEGYRLGISYTNTTSWYKEGVFLYDNNYQSYVTQTQYYSPILVNLVYENEAYRVDKFRYLNENGKVYTNVNDGAVLVAANNEYIDNLALVEGVRFNKNDILKVEDNASILNQSLTYSLSKINNVAYTDVNANSAKNISFTIEKTKDNYQSGCWELELLLDENNVLIKTGCHVEKDENQTRLAIHTANGSTGEQLNLLTESTFLLGGKYEFNGDDLIIDNSYTTRYQNLYVQLVNLYEETINDYEYYCYSYDIDSLNNVYESLLATKKEVDNLKIKTDSTSNYRYYTLLGRLNQLYIDILAATNRNEAVEVKATWYITNFSSQDANIENIKKHLQILKNGGVNEIIVTPIDDGVAIYESDIFPARNNISYGEYGNNYLKALISLAHEENIKVFACLTPFNAGLEKVFTELNDHKALSITGAESVVASQGKVSLLDPSSEQVQKRIKETINDILVSNPELDGIHLDYIRYGADNNNVNYVMGVTEDALAKFKEYCTTNGLSYSLTDLASLRTLLKENKAAFTNFNLFEQQMVTNTVRNVKEVCKEYDAPLTVAVADYYSLVKSWKCQDWAAWANEKLIDGIYLMDYYFDDYWVNYYLEDMIKQIKEDCLLVVGIDPSYAKLADEYYTRTIKGAVTNAKSNGFAIFGTHVQKNKYDGWDLVGDSNWIDSLSPYDSLEVTLKAVSELLLKRCDDIYIENGYQTKEQKETLKTDLDAVLASLTTDELTSANNAFDLLKIMTSNFYADGEANTRIREQLTLMKKLCKLKINIYE